MNIIKKYLKDIYYSLFGFFITKERSELIFWQNFLVDLERWFKGEIVSLYEEGAPVQSKKIIARSLQDSAILTWFTIHQKTKYLEDLEVGKDFFSGMKILDIGSGPMPSAIAFEGCEVYCLDPLLAEYVRIGFPLHYYERVKFINGVSENIPVDDDFFDAVISVNAIDHVNNLEKTALEIKRVLRPGGKMRMHIHYHKKVVTEPIEMNDEVVNRVFGWCPGFRKISESKSKRGFSLKESGEKYTVWSN